MELIDGGRVTIPLGSFDHGRYEAFDRARVSD